MILYPCSSSWSSFLIFQLFFSSLKEEYEKLIQISNTNLEKKKTNNTLLNNSIPLEVERKKKLLVLEKNVWAYFAFIHPSNNAPQANR